MKTMKKIAIPVVAFAFSLLLISFAPAGTVKIPDDKPAISVNIPDSWKPEETDKGIALRVARQGGHSLL
jgi:hypothetical protein